MHSHDTVRASSLALLLIAGDPLDYGRDVRPLLAKHCFPCHGPDESTRRAKLRLDREEFAHAERDGDFALVAGDPAASLVWQRITADDPREVMPPPSTRRTLSDGEKETLRAWIEQGARYAEHWAFVAPTRAPLPAVASAAIAAPPGSAAATAQAIDAFVRARLAQEGLAPAAEADRATLARRLQLDLLGLPPGADDIAAFVADRAPDAYERRVEQLLASPHFGERMALPWLDAARYADTNGFSIDGGRHAWLWRDWVIDAFNRNVPYDRFLLLQLAGDLLPDRSDATLTATGFQRNSMITHEGGTLAEENLVTYGADRVRTFGEAVLGLTVGCAQCHDHKFDPLTQRDYYALFDFFARTSEPAHGGDGGMNAPPTAKVRSVLVTGEEEALRARIAALEATLAAPDPAARAAWEAEQLATLARRGRDFALHPVTLRKISTPNTGSGFSIEAGRYARVERPMGFVAFDVAMEFTPPAAPITGLRLVMHADPEAPDAGWGFGGAEVGATGAKKSFVVTNVSLSAGSVASDQVNLHRLIDLARATASSWQGDDHPRGVLDTLPSGWIPALEAEGPVHLTVRFAEPLPRDATHLTAQVNFGRHGTPTARRIEFFLVSGDEDGSELAPAVIAALERLAHERSAADDALLADCFVRTAAATARTRIDLANARERLAARSEPFDALVMDEVATPRDTFVLARGNYAAPQEKVSAALPAFLPTFRPDAAAPPARLTRLDLARWAIDPRHPLTARVAVNRLWQLCFGVGLVRTASDFGLQGEWPSHRELLDWLAVDLVESGWDVKRMVRAIVGSATYRQSSHASDAALARDPDNRLLARGPRGRLPAELVRDAALSISGLLVAQLGGPSVNPYAPGDPWREISHYGSTPATAQTFVQDHGEKLWRRSLYTYWKRTLPPQSLALFDAPNRETCTFERAATNTPLQALVLLNDVQFVEAARAFAQRILRRPGNDAARLAWAFAEATGRAPRSEEAVVLERALSRERARYAADRAAAAALLAQGEAARDEALPLEEHAAWAQVAALLLNLSETISKN
ncbi:MAG: PSD1 domain-containing protein [Planctomycetes bacterium]|nr:PSD1 domain-containing protein [Planctomycetota bacterium]